MSTKKTILAAALAASLAASAVVRAEVEGRYRMEIFKADASGAEVEGSRRVAADWFENIITNNGLDFLGGGGGNDFGANVLVACRVGTGSTPAAETDNALVSHLAGTSTVNLTEQGANSVSPYYGWKRRTFRFALGAVVGNVSEVSVWTALTGGTMFSRALVESGGAPTTITILADEQLDVVYEARAYAQVGDLAWGPVTISGVDYSGTIRAAWAANASGGTGAYYWWASGAGTTGVLRSTDAVAGNTHGVFSTQTLGTVLNVPSGTRFPPTSITASAYTNGTYYRDHAMIWDLNDGNTAGGVGSALILTKFGAFQLSFTPKIDKTVAKRLTLNIRVSWARKII